MASSSSLRGAAPPPDQLASFYKLVDKRAVAGALCRHACLLELSARAAEQAEALFGGDDSLVVADLRMGEIETLISLAVEASVAEGEALLLQAWAVLLSVVPRGLLLRRIEAKTLLPGTVRAEELDYAAHVQAALKKAQNAPVPSPAWLRALASTLGYDTLLDANYNSLGLLQLLSLPAAQTRTVESFVLQGLDVIPRTAGLDANLIEGEGRLVKIFEADMNDVNS